MNGDALRGHDRVEGHVVVVAQEQLEGMASGRQLEIDLGLAPAKVSVARVRRHRKGREHSRETIEHGLQRQTTVSSLEQVTLVLGHGHQLAPFGEHAYGCLEFLS